MAKLLNSIQESILGFEATPMAEEFSNIIASDFINFLNSSPTAFHAVDESKKRLIEAGFEQISEREEWKLKASGKYFFTRNYSTIVAFAIGKRYEAGNGFFIIGAHTDSPCLKLKPTSKVDKDGFLEVGVQPYGGGLWHTWFDRDLTVAGRIITKKVNYSNLKPESTSYSHKLVRIDKPILRIPTLAIHLDRDVREGFKVNTQNHLIPILATSIKAELNREISKNGSVGIGSQKHHSMLMQLISVEAGCEPEDICELELQLCDTQPSLIGGAMKEFIFSGRLDNLCMSFCALKALIDATTSEGGIDKESGVWMVALFDNEEVGSNSAQGAGSPVILDAMSRITTSFSPDSKVLEQVIQKSFLVSADMAHALHPNYPEKHEENHKPRMHGGLVIKNNANLRYATTAVTSFLFKEIASLRNLPTQEFVVRNDTGCGSTIGPILASGVGIRTVDVGAPQLSMHSIREMCSVDDVYISYNHFKSFYLLFSSLDPLLLIDH